MEYLKELEKILNVVKEFIFGMLGIIPKLIGLVDIEQQIAFWAITTIISVIIAFRKQIFKG